VSPLEFIGVDLAWTTNGGTGLCAIENGRVTDSVRVTTDGEILAWLGGHAQSGAVVAIDAPLIVRNETGRRPCDQLISQCFGVHHASAHSANLGIHAFREGVRGDRIARALDLDLDPNFEPLSRVRRAIEVYPHPAIVALFDLPVTLKYKAKPSRNLLSRSAALGELMQHLERLIDRDPWVNVRTASRWEELTHTITSPASGAALSRAEDEVDAFVCAYVGLYYWTHGTARCRIAGDVQRGYIVTPVNESQGRCLDARAQSLASRARA
jgi:predicted RNase H-like nuclease